jgi:hypothetical protein
MNENTPPRLAIDLSSERVEYHRDTVEYLLQQEILRCQSEGISLTKTEVNNFRTELVKTLIIKHQSEKAVNLKIKEKK